MRRKQQKRGNIFFPLVFIFFFSLVLTINVSAVGINNPYLPHVGQDLTITNTNYTLINTNSSDYWDNLDTPTEINHDTLTNFVSNEHIDWTSTTNNFKTTGTVWSSQFEGYNDYNTVVSTTTSNAVTVSAYNNPTSLNVVNTASFKNYGFIDILSNKGYAYYTSKNDTALIGMRWFKFQGGYIGLIGSGTTIYQSKGYHSSSTTENYKSSYQSAFLVNVPIGDFRIRLDGRVDFPAGLLYGMTGVRATENNYISSIYNGVFLTGTFINITGTSQGVNINKNANANIPTLKVYGNNSGKISIWAEYNISATGYITRTSIYDKADGTALSQIKDASEYLDYKGDIEHDEFYGYVNYQVPDMSRPLTKLINKTVCDKIVNGKEEDCITREIEETTYPYTKTEEGVLLDKEIDLLRQAVYELKTENADLKTRLGKVETYLISTGAKL